MCVTTSSYSVEADSRPATAAGNSPKARIHSTLLISGLAPGPGGVQVFFLGQPSWSPDSKRIAFTSDWSGQYQLYSISAAGGGSLPLTTLGREQMLPGATEPGEAVR